MTNNSYVKNVFLSGAGFVGSGDYSSTAGGGYTGIWLMSANNITIENAALNNNSKAINDGFTVDDKYYEITIEQFSNFGMSANNTFRNVTIYGSSKYLFHNGTGVSNILENFSVCKDSSLVGCAGWDHIDMGSVQQRLNSSNLLVDPAFISLNSSYGNISLFNRSANITLEADCSPNLLHSVYRKEGFPSSSADIIANGTLYAPTHMECANGHFTFGVSSFSGYALQEGTLNLSILPSNTVIFHQESNVSCMASNPAVMLELYRNGVLVANGTSYIEDVQNLTAGTHLYVCNTTGDENHTSASATGTLAVRGLSTGGSIFPMSVSISGDRAVGSPITITVKDGSTPVDGAEVRVLYRLNGLLNAVNLGNTDSHGQVPFTPTIAGEYRIEATMEGYSGGELVFIVEEGEMQPPEEGNGMRDAGCAGGCPAGYGCINVQCVRIGQNPEDTAEPQGILPVVASPAWESATEPPADREVSSSPEQQGAAPQEEGGEPANPLLFLVPLAVAAALVFLMLRKKQRHG
jgi:hypothetical protein